MNLIQTQNLTKKFGNFTAVKNLNIKICSGELTAYLGSNGAGKSTTIAMLINNLKPTSGTIVRQPKLKIGVVFQNSILDSELTVWQNLTIRSAIKRETSKEEIRNLMKKTGVAEIANRNYGELSGGMKRKVDITRALINHPNVLFLDEPTTGLDVNARHEIWKLINQLKDGQKLAVFLTIYYLEEAENADNVYILNRGRIVEHGSAQELKQKYSKMKLKIKLNSVADEQLISQLSLKDDYYEYQCSNSEKAISFLNKYGHQVKYFEYMPIEMTDVFTKLIKEEA